MTPSERLQACYDYVQTVDDNIHLFLKDKPHKATLHLESLEDSFADFYKSIGAEGELAECLKIIKIKSNPSGYKEDIYRQINNKLKRNFLNFVHFHRKRLGHL